MRKSICRDIICKVCEHPKKQHRDDGEFWVECCVKDCKCEEYDEPYYYGDDD